MGPPGCVLKMKRPRAHFIFYNKAASGTFVYKNKAASGAFHTALLYLDDFKKYNIFSFYFSKLTTYPGTLYYGD